MYKCKKRSAIFKPVLILVNRVNHMLARKHLGQYPQIAIFSFDLIGLRVNLEGRFEKDTLNSVFEFLRSLDIDLDGCALDIGANIGNHALFFSAIFPHVIAFEPNPRVFKLLEFNVADTNVEARNHGLSDRRAALPFKVIPENIGGSHVTSTTASSDDSGAVQIQVERLDDVYQPGLEKIALMKIDVEGHEAEVLLGAERLVATHGPIILFEQIPNEIENGSSRAIDILRQWNYKFYTISKNFSFGDGKLSKIGSLLCHMVFGEREIFQKTDRFPRRYYEMIVAVPGAKPRKT